MMNILKIFINTNEEKYFTLMLDSVISFLIMHIIKIIILKVMKLIKDDRKSYKYYSSAKLVINIIYFLTLLFIWSEYIHNIITLISILSAAFTIALRDVISNWICGIFIKLHKPFKLEDRIEINGVKGDVIALNILGFELLEVSEREPNGQSTGIVMHFPNSLVFTSTIKNLTKGFKYIWNEVSINIKIDSDLRKNKQTIYKIINNIDIVKSIPKKMKNQIKEVSTEYRIYYNNYDPIIYTRIDKNHVVLTLRYLIDPKKARFVESTFWNKIHDAYENGDLDLFLEAA